MSQAFSLYGELTVRQNLELHAQLYHLPSGQDRRPHQGAVEALRSGSRRQRQARKPAARHQAEAAARRGGAARARHSHSRRADLRRRSDRARRVLAHADRSVARRRRHDLSLDPFHERGGALRPHLADARRQGAGGRRATGTGQGARQRFAGGHVCRLSRGRGRHRPHKEGRSAGADAASTSRRSRSRAPKRFDLARLWAYARRETVELLRDPIRLAFAVCWPDHSDARVRLWHFLRHRKPANGGVRSGQHAAKPAVARRLFRARAISRCSRRSNPPPRRSGGCAAAIRRSSSKFPQRFRPRSAERQAHRRSTRRSTAP